MKIHERGATRSCSGCNTEKPVGDFYKRKTRAGDYVPTSRCKSCYKVVSDETYKRNREKVLKQQARRREAKADEIAEYMRSWYRKNKEKVLPRMREYNARPERKESEKIRQRKRYLEKKPEIMAKRSVYRATDEYKALSRKLYRRHYESNKQAYIVRGAERRARRVRAMPGWYKRGDAKPFHDLARKLTLETGEKHVVDHIVPLKGDTVCGLHVKENLRVIPAIENLRKANKLVEEIVRY